MSEKTYKYESNNNRTDETSLLGQNISGRSARMHQLAPGQAIDLKGKPYTIVEIISSGTGEANVYKINDERRDEFVLKLYFEYSNAKEEPNLEALIRISTIIDPDILLLHDFGVGADKYQGKYCYEITSFAEGGDLLSVADFKLKYTPQFIEEKVVPEIFNGIKKLHQHRIYHCDLKPGNIFYKDAEQTDLVIGDYGSAKTSDMLAELDSRKMSTVKGTEAYLSPEQARGIVDKSNDYYSFGIILLHLLYPDQFAKDDDFTKVDKIKFGKIVERQTNKKPIIQYKPSFLRLNNLIEGLTNIISQKRFGEKEIDRWLKGEFVEILQDDPAVKPIKLGSVTIRDEKQLITYIDGHPNWYEDLIQDKETFSIFKEWIISYKDAQVKKQLEYIIKVYEPYGKRFIGEAICRYFQPERDLRIDMHTFNLFKASDRQKETAHFIHKLDEIWKITRREQMLFYLFCLEFSLMQLNSMDGKTDPLVFALYNTYLAVFGLIPNSENGYRTSIQDIFNPKNLRSSGLYMLRLFYTFNRDRTFRDASNHPINSLDNIGFYFLNHENDFDDINLVLEREKFMSERKYSISPSLKFSEFIFSCFAEKVELQLEIEEIEVDKKRNYKVRYKAFKTLNNFLKSLRINRQFSDTPDTSLQLEFKGSVFGSVVKESDKFVELLKERHKPFQLKEPNIEALKRKFKSITLPQLYQLFLPQGLALVISFILFILIILLLMQMIQIGEGWSLIW